MKKNGYTLIELVTVIALLSLVAVIIIPSINSSIQSSRADQLGDIREDISHSIDIYLNSNGVDYE